MKMESVDRRRMAGVESCVGRCGIGGCWGYGGMMTLCKLAAGDYKMGVQDGVL